MALRRVGRLSLDEGNGPLDPVEDPGLVGLSAVLATKGIVGRHRVLLAGRVRRADRSEGFRPPRPRSADPTGGLSGKAISQSFDREAGRGFACEPRAGPMPIGIPAVAIGATDEPICRRVCCAASRTMEGPRSVVPNGAGRLILTRRLIMDLDEALDLALKRGETGIKAAAFAGGKLVTEVWAGTVADRVGAAAVDEATVFPIFSVTKAVTATAVHLQAERGLIEYDGAGRHLLAGVRHQGQGGGHDPPGPHAPGRRTPDASRHHPRAAGRLGLGRRAPGRGRAL